MLADHTFKALYSPLEDEKMNQTKVNKLPPKDHLAQDH